MISKEVCITMLDAIIGTLYSHDCKNNAQYAVKVLEYVAGTSDIPLVDINHMNTKQITIIEDDTQ